MVFTSLPSRRTRMPSLPVTSTFGPAGRQMRTLFRGRLPERWKAVLATIDGVPRSVDEQGTVDLSGSQGKVTVRFAIRPW